MNISATLGALEIKKKRIEKGLKTYNFGLGENPIPVPKILQEEFKNSSHIKNYESIEGTEKVRDIIKTKFSNKNYKIDNIIFGNGSKELLFLIQLIFDGVVIIVSPYWVSYIEHSKILNKKYEIIETKIENDFKLQIEELEEVCKKYINNNKLLIFNSPNNPTGIFYLNEELENISKIINKYNVIVYADELYNKLIYLNNYKLNSISYYCPKLTIRSHSLSKVYGLGGWRCGWNTFPKELDYLFEKMKIYGVSIYSCITTPLLNITNKALENNIEIENHIIKTKKIFSIVMNYVYTKLKNNTNLIIVKPNSSWYIFLDFSNYIEQFKKINIYNSIDLTNTLQNKGFICVPGIKFGYKNISVRLSCVDIDIKKLDKEFTEYGKNIKEGIDILIYFLSS